MTVDNFSILRYCTSVLVHYRTSTAEEKKMDNAIRILPRSDRKEADHSFINFPGGQAALFAGWGPKL